MGVQILFMNLKRTLVSFTALLGLVALFSIVANAATVTVKPGDTMKDIALKYHTTVDEIKLQNNITEIFPGQELNIVPSSQLKDEERQKQLEALKVAAQKAEQQRQAELRAQEEAKRQQEELARQQEEQRRQQEELARQQAAQQAAMQEQAAKEFVAMRESGGSYTARNGIYYGRYQLTISYLNGDLSPANQERVAQQYVASRYGSWVAAKAHWQANGWF